MRSSHELIAEIHKLIDEQMEALNGNLTPDEAVSYIARKERIQHLLNEIRDHGDIDDNGDMNDNGQGRRRG
jgi:hypothetical protein